MCAAHASGRSTDVADGNRRPVRTYRLRRLTFRGKLAMAGRRTVDRRQKYHRMISYTLAVRRQSWPWADIDTLNKKFGYLRLHLK